MAGQALAEQLRDIVAPTATGLELDYIDGMLAARAWADATQFCRETAHDHGLTLPVELAA